MEHWTAIAAERRALADLLDGLEPAQWSTQSLCDAWTVRDVAAHLALASNASIPRFLLAAVKARGNFHRASEALTSVEAQRPTEEIVADFRLSIDKRVAPPTMGSVAPLTDILVHSQDMRIPLGVPDDRPVEPWRGVLDFLVTSKARRGFVSKRLPNLRYVATDLDWSHGAGEELTGPAKALALTMLGRPARVDELSGPGAGAMRSWLAR
jgi:uncharacterized protein (TIGR03083 family)